MISSDGFELPDLSSVIVDLLHDGRKELLVRTLDDEYKGARPVRTFTHVYKVVDGKAYQADAEFGSFYSERRVPEIQARLRALAAAEPGEAVAEPAVVDGLNRRKREEAAVLEAERARIAATIGR